MRSNQKKQLDEQRKKMKQDILNKKKELVKTNQTGGIKVELVGLPETMISQDEPENKKAYS
jgi:hypothetical protein